jgi:hypothetical protein
MLSAYHIRNGAIVYGLCTVAEMEAIMATHEYRGISYDDPRRQSEFEQLLGAVAAAEQERDPVGQRHAKAERDLEDGSISEDQFRTIDDQYIAANNRIAAAKRAVDAFLTQNNDYRTQ